jgi:hypothetical protein
MQDEQDDQATEEPTADAGEEPTADAGEEPTADAGDDDLAATVDEQAATSDGSAAEAAPEVPDDASAKIKAAQEHIDSLDMDQERAAAKKAI